jgi:hypothetical protein
MTEAPEQDPTMVAASIPRGERGSWATDLRVVARLTAELADLLDGDAA